jgi:hypothetical protein
MAAARHRSRSPVMVRTVIAIIGIRVRRRSCSRIRRYAWRLVVGHPGIRWSSVRHSQRQCGVSEAKGCGVWNRFELPPSVSIVPNVPKIQPRQKARKLRNQFNRREKSLVGERGFEPPTPWSRTRFELSPKSSCLNQISTTSFPNSCKHNEKSMEGLCF